MQAATVHVGIRYLLLLLSLKANAHIAVQGGWTAESI